MPQDPKSSSTKAGSWVRQVPLVTGILGGVLLMGNRLMFTPDLLNSQSRSDALGILLSALLILTGLLWQQSQPSPPPAVELNGSPGFWLDPSLSETQQLDLGWASRTVLALTAAQSVAIWFDSKLLLRRGILPPGLNSLELNPSELPSDLDQPWDPGSISRRAMQTGRAVYLVDLKLYPARGEFTDRLLPDNTASLLCQPIGSKGVFVVGTHRPRTLTPQDQAWIEAIAQRLELILQQDPGQNT